LDFKREVAKIKMFGQIVPQPQILMDFLGFEKHVRQIREKRGVSIWPGWYDHAAYYVNDLPPEKIYCDKEEVIIPASVKAADYELELACLVTESVLIKSFEQALDFFQKSCLITILNDWSARDVQLKDMLGLGPAHSKAIIGKSLGPRFISAEELTIDDYGVFNMSMRLKVNGEERLSSNYNSIYYEHPQTGKKQAWTFPRLMHFLGEYNISLHPGYLLGSGTIGSGCIAEFMAKLDPATGNEIDSARYPWLKDGDVVQLEVEKIGSLENKVKVLKDAKILDPSMIK